MKASKLVMAFAVVAVLAMAFTSVGYAYTASTENSNNSVTSQYVTLTQQNYTFSNTALGFDVIDTEAETVYQLVGGYMPLMDIGTKTYYGVLIGEDRLKATITGASDQVLGISVTAQNVGGSFTDFSNDPAGWRYVLKVTEDDGFILLHQGSNSASRYTVVTVPAEGGSAGLARNQLVNSSVSLSSGTWYDVNGGEHTTSYTVNAADADSDGFILLYQVSNAVNSYTVVTVSSEGESGGVTRNLVEGTGSVPLASGTWYDVNGVKHTTSYTVSAGDAYSKEDQYAYYDGYAGGIWKMDERHIDSEYTVTPADPDAGGFICLHGYVSWTKYTVILVDGSGTNQDPYTVTYKSLSAGEQVSNVTGWYIDGREIRTDKYTVSPEDADPGGNIVIYKTGSTDGKFTVIKNSGSGVSLVAGKKDIGDTVTGVAGWHARAMKLNIETGTTYVTKLYFAGPGEDSAASIKSAGSVIKVQSQISLTPVWTPAGAGDKLSYTLSAGDGTGADRIVYVESGSTVILPENIFTPPANKVFVGWKADNLDKIFEPWHLYANFTESRTFTAQWAAADYYFTVTFASNTGSGTMDTKYIYKNTDSGNTYTLPKCQYTKYGYDFGGWTVTGTNGTYSLYTEPFQDIPAVKENITVTANWTECMAGTGHVSISDQGTYTVVKVDDSHNVTVKSGLKAGSTVTCAGTWHVNGRSFTDNYTVSSADVGHGGFILLYQHIHNTGVYDIVQVAGNDGRIIVDKTVGEEIDYLGGGKVNGAAVYGGIYKVRAADADSGGNIVLYGKSNPAGKYTVITVDNSYLVSTYTGEESYQFDIKQNGTVKFRVNGSTIYDSNGTVLSTIKFYDDDACTSQCTEWSNGKTVYRNTATVTVRSDMSVGDKVTGVTGWYVNGGSALAGDYTITIDDPNAVNGFIVIYKTANATGKYTVVKVGDGGYSATRNNALNSSISGISGWKVKGEDIGTYKVRAEDAGPGGYILAYKYPSAEYLIHSGEDGYYILPYDAFAPPQDPGMDGFKGWKYVGWSVIANEGRTVAQCFTMPYGDGGYIVNNGTIKFTYKNDLTNEGS